MSTREVKLQNPSAGILYENPTNRSKLCTFAHDNVKYKDELYIFRCPVEKECCGRGCCIPGPAGIPLWLLILLLILLGILLVVITAGIIYLCKKLCKKSSKPTSPSSKSPPRYRQPTPPPTPPPIPVKTAEKQNTAVVKRGEETVTILTDFDSSIDDDYRSRRKNLRLFGTAANGVRNSKNDPSTPSTEPPSSEVSTRVASSAEGSSFGGGIGPQPYDSTRRLVSISEKPFVADRVEETYLPPPEPIAVQAHDERDYA